MWLNSYEKRKQNGDTVLSQESQDSLDSLESHSSTFDEILACQKEIARLEKEELELLNKDDLEVYKNVAELIM